MKITCEETEIILEAANEGLDMATIENEIEEGSGVYCCVDYKAIGPDDPAQAMSFASEIMTASKRAQRINSWGLEVTSGIIPAKRQEVLRTEYRKEFRC